jgi:hypothetical protein
MSDQTPQPPGSGLPQQPASAELGQPPPAPKRRSRRTVLVWLAAGAAVLVTLVVIGALASSSGSKATVFPAATTPALTEGPTIPSSDTAPPETSEVPQEEPSVGKVGDTVTVTQEGADAADITITSISVARVEPGSYGSTPERALFLVLRVSAEGTGSAFDVNPLDFYVAGSDGEHYEDATYSTAWGPSFESGTIHDGEHIKGTLVYDVSPKARHGKIVYAPNLAESPVATWT